MKNSLADRLNQLLKIANGQEASIRLIIDTLEGRGQAILVVLLALPFCFPIQIPGVSTIFGTVLMFIGLRIAFGHHSWIPAKLLDRTVSYSKLEKAVAIAISLTEKLRFLTKTRMVYLVKIPILHMSHGLTITLLALLLALPIPIPLTNIFAAVPAVAFGLGLLEDDGLMICVAYILTYICIAVFILLAYFGNELLASFYN